MACLIERFPNEDLPSWLVGLCGAIFANYQARSGTPLRGIKCVNRAIGTRLL